MQGFRVESKNWKQAVIKSTPIQSRIYAGKDLPNKFSPTRLIAYERTPSPLVKSIGKSYSHNDTILSSSLRISQGKEGTAEVKEENKTPRSMKAESEAGKSQQVAVVSPLKKREEANVVMELKLQFLRFKERILKQLSRQEAQIKVIISQILQKLEKVQSPLSIDTSASQPKIETLLPPTPQFQNFQQPISMHLDNFTLINAQKNSPATEKEQGAALSSPLNTFTPQIRMRIGKFQELLEYLHKDLSESSAKEEKWKAGMCE